MKLTTLLTSFTLASAVVALPAFADETNTPRVDQRETHQQQRIEQGEKSGSLTTSEAAKLNAREDKLKADEAAAKADGKVTKKERAHLKHEENRDSKAIANKKHNKKTAPPATTP